MSSSHNKSTGKVPKKVKKVKKETKLKKKKKKHKKKSTKDEPDLTNNVTEIETCRGGKNVLKYHAIKVEHDNRTTNDTVLETTEWIDECKKDDCTDDVPRSKNKIDIVNKINNNRNSNNVTSIEIQQNHTKEGITCTAMRKLKKNQAQPKEKEYPNHKRKQSNGSVMQDETDTHPTTSMVDTNIRSSSFLPKKAKVLKVPTPVTTKQLSSSSSSLQEEKCTLSLSKFNEKNINGNTSNINNDMEEEQKIDYRQDKGNKKDHYEHRTTRKKERRKKHQQQQQQLEEINGEIPSSQSIGNEDTTGVIYAVEQEYELETGARPLVESSGAIPGKRNDNNERNGIIINSNMNNNNNNNNNNNITLLLFYQYLDPLLTDREYRMVLHEIEDIGIRCKVSGRMRIATEGFNCTLTGLRSCIYEFCKMLRQWKPRIFYNTEFKLTHDLPTPQRFPCLKIIPVLEIVNYGLSTIKTTQTTTTAAATTVSSATSTSVPIPSNLSDYTGIHLEPAEYHTKLAEPDTVVIDVRNHYEALIGRFDPPTIKQNEEGGLESSTTTTTTTATSATSVHGNTNTTSTTKWLDPKMRKSTEFPIWLDDPKTKEQLRNKQVLMYCTGGIRCERASALLRYKMEHDDTMKQLNIQGVYQLQGGIDKYFKEFPDGGYWKGKNYVFDKRFAHAPTTVMSEEMKKFTTTDASSNQNDAVNQEVTEAVRDQKLAPVTTSKPLGRCEACSKPWDMYRGKRRCPTCGVPSLICKECFIADRDGTKKLDRTVRCDLCVEQNIYSKKQLNEHQLKQPSGGGSSKTTNATTDVVESVEHHSKKHCHTNRKMAAGAASGKRSSTNNTAMERSPAVLSQSSCCGTRLLLKNMCRTKMTEQTLVQLFPGITHIVWKNDRTTGAFLGSAWVEMESNAAAQAFVQRSGEFVLGRPLFVEYQPAGSKDFWPPPSSKIVS